jgi:hypothetical protein
VPAIGKILNFIAQKCSNCILFCLPTFATPRKSGRVDVDHYHEQRESEGEREKIMFVCVGGFFCLFGVK